MLGDDGREPDAKTPEHVDQWLLPPVGAGEEHVRVPNERPLRLTEGSPPFRVPDQAAGEPVHLRAPSRAHAA